MAVLTKKQAKKYEGGCYAFSDKKTHNYVFYVKKAHKDYCEGIKILFHKGFTNILIGTILLDSEHMHGYNQIKKEEFKEMLSVKDKLIEKML